jgi:hypothetical protein
MSLGCRKEGELSRGPGAGLGLRLGHDGGEGEVAQALEGVGEGGDDFVDAGVLEAAGGALDVVEVGPQDGEDLELGEAAAQALGEMAGVGRGTRLGS